MLYRETIDVRADDNEMLFSDLNVFGNVYRDAQSVVIGVKTLQKKAYELISLFSTSESFKYNIYNKIVILKTLTKLASQG